MPRLLVITAALTLGGCAKVVVVRVPPNQPAMADGVIYALPSTVVRLQVKIDRARISNEAPYMEFSKIFVPDGKPICKAKCTAEEKLPDFSMQQGVTFSTYGEPDPQNVYIVKFTGGGAIDQTLSMTWNEAGLLSAATASVTNRTIDIAVSSLKLAAGLGTKAAGFGAAVAKDNMKHCADRLGDDPDETVIPILTKASAYSSSLIENYCAINAVERKQLAMDSDQLGAAVDAFTPVAKLETTRDDILAGANQSLQPAELLTLVEAEINKQLTRLYLGSKATVSWEGMLDIRSIAAGSNLTVLNMNSKKGICIANASIPPEAKALPEGFMLPSGECDAADPVDLRIDYYPVPAGQLFSKITNVDSSDRSFRYRLPAQVKAELRDAKKAYGSGVFSVAQLGTIVSLPAKRSSKTLSYDLAFVEATGALKTFKLGTAGGLDSATIDALSGVGGTLLDARNKAQQNEADSAVLTREDQLLKLKDDICTIQKKYGIPCTVQP